MKNKKILRIIFQLFILLLMISLSVLLYIKNLDAINKNKKYINEKKYSESLEKTINNLELENKHLKLEIDNNKPADEKICTFTHTYRFIEFLDYKGTVPTEKYILVAKYQDGPVVIRINTEKISINFEVGKNYEFEFENLYKYRSDLSVANLVNVKETDKSGLDQIQDICSVD